MTNSIREIEYSINKNSIQPVSSQSAGMQGDHNSTTLKFKIEASLMSALKAAISENEKIYYRFDAYNSAGDYFPTVPSELNLNESTADVNYDIPEYVTRYGGNGVVYVVFTVINSDEEKEAILYSFPAKIHFKNAQNGVEKAKEIIEDVSEVSIKAMEILEKAEYSARAAEYSQRNALNSENAAKESEQKAEKAKEYVDNIIQNDINSIYVTSPIGKNLTLKDSANNEISELIFYGNTWQTANEDGSYTVESDRNPTIRLSGKNYFNIDALVTSVHVKNMGDGTLKVYNSYPAYCNQTLKQLCPNLEVGKRCVLSMETTGIRAIYLDKTKFTWQIGKNTTITEEMLNSLVGFYPIDVTSKEMSIISKIQIEEGSVATEYNAYFEPVEVEIDESCSVFGGNMLLRAIPSSSGGYILRDTINVKDDTVQINYWVDTSIDECTTESIIDNTDYLTRTPFVFNITNNEIGQKLLKLKTYLSTTKIASNTDVQLKYKADVKAYIDNKISQLS